MSYDQGKKKKIERKKKINRNDSFLKKAKAVSAASPVVLPGHLQPHSGIF